MIVNNVNLPDLDTGDAIMMEHYEKVVNDTTKKINKVSETSGTRSVKIRAICTAIFEAFNELFGEGTDRKVFGNAVNLNTCIDAYGELIDNVNNLDKQLGQQIRNKFTPNQNRAQRRHKSKKKHYNNKPRLNVAK